MSQNEHEDVRRRHMWGSSNKRVPVRQSGTTDDGQPVFAAECANPLCRRSVIALPEQEVRTGGRRNRAVLPAMLVGAALTEGCFAS